MRLVSALCVSGRSVYKKIAGVDAYDQRRDVRSFEGGTPIVAHPPCRAWSAFTRHQAKPAPGEAELGPLCVEHLRREGGVLEHPAHSRLFKATSLPLPGEKRGDLVTVAVWQAWWGYPMRKATWLCFSRVDTSALEFPFSLHAPGSDRRRQQLMSKKQRSETVPAFARWLVDAARSAL